ncbi:MAG: dephospho-CoA kinase [SAR202 cluster bacterium]|nr:dephospho-CoA kinase [SAR202 cluster bacterium]|tara:strand:+ start:5707 stop:6330 length:624 start_codon:yes stop_codon:yes gene_type:complete
MLVIGLAGGIGSGKSSVSSMLKNLGAVIIDADKLGHEVYLPGTEGLREVVSEFGKDILSSDGEVDRRILGSKVFGSPEAMAKLNSIVWPRIKNKVTELIEENSQLGTEVLVLDAAVLIEAGWTSVVDETWVVTAPIDQIISRLESRNGITEEQAMSRINSQMTTEERMEYADIVIENDASLDELMSSVQQIWEKTLSNKGLAGRQNG